MLFFLFSNHMLKIKSIIIISLALTGIIFSQHLVSAQSNTPASGQTNQDLIPVITSDNFIQAGKAVLFDASESITAEDDAPVQYLWTFSDTLVKKTDKEVIRSFETTGKHEVTLTIRQGNEERSQTKIIFVYDTRIVLVTDGRAAATLADIERQAAEQGILLTVITADEAETGFLTEEGLIKTYTEHNEEISAAQAFIFYTRTHIGLAAFTRYWQNISDEQIKRSLQERTFMVLTDENMDVSKSVVAQTFGVIKPRYMLLTRTEALNPFFEHPDGSTLIESLDRRAIAYRIIDERVERSSLFPISRLMTKFVTSGIPSNTIFLLLAFPFIALIITVARDILGLTTFGVFTPAMIATAFLILGINLGVVTLIYVIAAGSLIRFILGKTELLYIPRTALVLSLVAISFILVMWALLTFNSAIAISLAVFPMLVMSTVTEKFISAQTEEGMKYALMGVLQTVLVAISAYYFVTWQKFVSLITGIPELVLVPLLLITLIGKFTGLRLTEYFRFRHLLKGEGTEE